MILYQFFTFVSIGGSFITRYPAAFISRLKTASPAPSRLGIREYIVDTSPRSSNSRSSLNNRCACSSGSLDPSHVLSAMGIARDEALGSLRVSFDERVTLEELDAFCDALLGIVSAK